MATGLALAAPAVALARHLGWMRGWPAVSTGSTAPGRRRAWPRATGWDRIPRALRPGPPRARFDLGRDLDGDKAPEEIELHWLGHAGFLLSWRGTRLLIDPNTRDRCTVSPRLLEPAADPSTFGRIDGALITHGHYDHLDLPTLAAVPELGEIVLPAGSEEYLRPLAARTRVTGLVPAPDLADLAPQGRVDSDPAAPSRHRIGAIEIVAVPAVHHGNRFHPLASRRLALGYVLRTDRAALYVAGDTGAGPHFAHFKLIGDRFRPRLALLPIGAFSPAVPVGRVHLSPEQAVAAARELGGEPFGRPGQLGRSGRSGPSDRKESRPPLVVPCHFGTFVLALDRETTALPRFARAARRAGVEWAMPRLLAPSDPTAGTDADATV